MTRDAARLAERPFDVLVVGGGIYGLMIAYDAALRGLRTALVERHDFGSGSSFNHQKTLHGGLRYLQSLDLRRMRLSVRERRTMARIAPSLVSPLAFGMPLPGSATRNRWTMRTAFLLDRAVAADRNRGVPASHTLPPARIVARDAVERLVPDARFPDASYAALWYDYRMDEADRLTIGVALAAARHGAVLVNYASAIEALRDGRRICGMVVRDEVGGERIDVRSGVVVNAAGAGAGRLMAAFGARRAYPLVKAMNLVTSRPAGEAAVAQPGPTGRMLVALPWRGRLVIGTAHGRTLAGADDTRVSEEEVQGFLAEANAAFPWLALARDEIALVHRGVVPARHTPGREPELLDQHAVRDHARDGTPGAISVTGVKYTTARAVAAQAVDAACRALGKPAGRSATAERPLLGPLTSSPAGLDADLADRLAALYGASAEAVAAIIAANPALGFPVSSASPVTAAEVVHAVRGEAALTLEDVIVRRTGLGAAGHPGDDVVRRCAAIVASELGWSPERLASEAEELGRFYEISRSPTVGKT